MVKNSRKSLLFALGLVLGVAAGAVGMLSLRDGDGPYTGGTPLPSTRSMGAPASTAFVAAVAGNCEMAPVLPSAGNGDGREVLQGKPGAASDGEVASLVLSGKEAAAAGRQRDAEIDFLNACRNAATLKDGDPIPLADAMYQLGRHYANVAALGGSRNKDLFQRAERLYSASLEGFRARYGEDHEKTKFAREGLITVQQATGGKPPAALAKAPPPPPAAPAPAAPAVEAAASAPAVVTAPAAAPIQAPVVQAPPEPAKPEVAKAPSEPPKRAPRITNTPRATEEARPRDSAPVLAEPRPVAPGTPPRAERRVEPETPAAAIPEERPRPQVRRSPPVREAEPTDDVAVDVPPPPPRRPRPIVAEPQPEVRSELPPPPPPPSDYSSSGAGAAPTAEGSAGTP